MNELRNLAYESEDLIKLIDEIKRYISRNDYNLKELFETARKERVSVINLKKAIESIPKIVKHLNKAYYIIKDELSDSFGSIKEEEGLLGLLSKFESTINEVKKLKKEGKRYSIEGPGYEVLRLGRLILQYIKEIINKLDNIRKEEKKIISEISEEINLLNIVLEDIENDKRFGKKELSYFRSRVTSGEGKVQENLYYVKKKDYELMNKLKEINYTFIEKMYEMIDKIKERVAYDLKYASDTMKSLKTNRRIYTLLSKLWSDLYSLRTQF